MRNPFQACARAVVTILLLAAAGRTADPVRSELEYELRFEKPNTHLMDITIRADHLGGASVEFAMPAWAPGNYEIEDYAVNVQGLSATGENNKALAWRKTDKQTWRIELGGSHSATVRYQVFGNTMENAQAQYNDHHAALGGPAVWMYLAEGKERPIRLTVEPPAGWKIATGMPAAGTNTFTALDYDTFADSPLEISDFAESDFTTSGTTYHLVVDNYYGRKDFSGFAADVRKIVETLVPIFAPVAATDGAAAPFRDYWFLIHIWPATASGLEHLNSTQIQFNTEWESRAPATPFGNQYNLKLFFVAHEFFHAWNVKRLRPRPLGPFDYSREAYTSSLWFSEGLTSYYGGLALVRAGLISPQEYLDEIARVMTNYDAAPGRRVRSLEDTSWDVWLKKATDADTNLKNTYFSYYDGGQIAGHLLDFAIRNATANARSLDDGMRRLYSRNALPKPGFLPEDLPRILSEAAGTDLSEVFHRYVSGTSGIPYETFFEYAGISVERGLDPNQIWIGAEFARNSEGRAVLRSLEPGSPAEKAGLDEDDQVLAVDGKPTDAEQFVHAVIAHRPGETVRLTVQHLGETRDIAVVLAADPHPIFRLVPMQHPSEAQQKIYRSWLGLR